MGLHREIICSHFLILSPPLFRPPTRLCPSIPLCPSMVLLDGRTGGDSNFAGPQEGSGGIDEGGNQGYDSCSDDVGSQELRSGVPGDGAQEEGCCVSARGDRDLESGIRNDFAQGVNGGFDDARIGMIQEKCNQKERGGWPIEKHARRINTRTVLKHFRAEVQKGQNFSTPRELEAK